MDLLGAVTLFLVICLSCLLLLSTWRQMQGWGKMPPGPTPLPLLGNLLQVQLSDMRKSLMKISERYGPVYTLRLASRRVVVLCGYQAVKEALLDQAEEFSGRGEQATFSCLFEGYGVIFSNEERAKQLRRLSITTLRNFGVGKRGIEERILEEAHFLLEAFRTVSNVISSVVFGDRFDYEDEEFISLLSMMMDSFHFTATAWGQLYEMLSGTMRYLPGPQRAVFKQLVGLEKFIERKVKANQETLDPNSPQDFIDCFLVKMQQEKENPSSQFSLKNIVLTALNVFFARTETVSTTLRYGFLLLLKYPEIEERIHEEIDRVIGRNRVPSMEDRSRMPYTNAVIHEFQRFCDVLPMGVARRVTRDTQFREYTIPKGTEVYPMLGSVLYDPTQFSNPDTFDPGHFLDGNGQFKRSDAFVPFSIGKRYCFGEMLARMELFLFIAGILQNFRFRSRVEPKDIDISPKLVGFATLPRSYEICLVPC
uniref:Cytochrome P450 2A13-like n=1 Tax=Gopherus evgoodei TaxID=1825980 RepID=A0A8C4Y7W5_9SAUR